MHEVLRKFNFEIVETHRDVRTLNIEKVLTLLGWSGVLRVG